MGRVIDMARLVDDMALNSIQAPPRSLERALDDATMQGIDQNARAYDTNTIGRMALMTYGRYMAALNAETYAQTAIYK